MLFNLIRLIRVCWLWGITFNRQCCLTWSGWYFLTCICWYLDVDLLSNRHCCSTWTGLYCDVDCGSKRLSSNCTSVLLNFDMVIRSCYLRFIMSKKKWWYHRGNKKLIIEGQTMPWPKRDKKINNGQHNTTPKTKDWATRILHKPRVNSGTPEE